MMYLRGWSVVFLIASINAQFEGESCIKNGVDGVCKIIFQCQAALDDIRNRRTPQKCSFSGNNPVVCCVENGPALPTTTARPPVATTPKRPSTTTEYIPPVADYQNTFEGECGSVDPQLTDKKTGQKAWDKCIEYQEQLVYPCRRSVGLALSSGKSRTNQCHHKGGDLVIGGVAAVPNEFPHMALLGFGPESGTAAWLCGGTVISDRFILTAAHCIASRDNGPVTFAILGSLKRSSQLDPNTQLYKIQDIIPHPEYKAPIKYHDIALLRTQQTIALSSTIVPACLHTTETHVERAAATGWGLTKYNQAASTADVLQKVTLTKFTSAECSAKFTASRLLKRGFDSSSQICYGDKMQSKDTCQGDSGGPLQILNKRIDCMYTVIGVTSFGKACGVVGDPGIYTKVVNYVPWIEGIVWP